MNVKQIKELARIVRENGLSALEVSENDTRIRIECTAQCIVQAPVAMQPIAVQPVAAQPTAADSPVDFNKVRELRSQMVGVFYAAPAPDAKPFVAVGQRVRKGEVVCIIEAMKLMNEIVSDFDGEVVDVCVKNGDVVEYGQTLFKLC